MRGSEATAGVAMKVLVKKNVVAKVWIVLEPVIVTARGAPAMRVGEKQSRQAAFQLDGHVVDGHVVARASRALDLELVSVVVVELLERLDDDKIHGKPD